MTQGRLSTDDIVIRPAAPGEDPGVSDDPRVTGDVGPDPRADGRTDGPDRTAADADGAAGRRNDNAPLLDDSEAEDFLRRWSEVQTRFVDDPRGAVLDGDSLVAELVQALASRFSQHKSGLEEQWSRGGEPSTEELRLALQQYRSFFQRLLAT
jgi:hypothetical protein